jgi:glc operon protein GlcG
MLNIQSLSLAEAKAVAAAARGSAESSGWKVVIAILDAGGHLLYLERADGTQLGSIAVAQEKARTALLFKRPTKALEDLVLGGKAHMMTLPGATLIEGGVPLVYGSEIVGAIGISGALSSEDGQVALAGARALTKL